VTAERTYLATAVPCNSHDNGLHGGRAPCEDIMPAFMGRGRCVHCIGDGTRLDLDSLREVERGPLFAGVRSWWETKPEREVSPDV
jgi:hypothetical protein